MSGKGSKDSRTPDFKARREAYDRIFSKKEKPIYTHDCTKCIFLGNYSNDEADFDLYFCKQGTLNNFTVLARYSNDGPDYSSGMYSQLPELVEAVKRAKLRNLI